MRKIDLFVLVAGLFGAIAWIIVSSKDGYKANSATIVARSISITSTIDGQVENDPPPVGRHVGSNDLLVRIHNGRFDRSRLVELKGQVAFLDAEIGNVSAQQAEIGLLLKEYQTRAKSYSTWMLEEVSLKAAENAAALEIAERRQQLTSREARRAGRLYKKKLASQASLQTSKTEAMVAESQVKLNRAQLKRNELLLATLKRDGIFFDNGDTSYWSKMADTLQVRLFDNASKISSFKTQLAQAKMQAGVEEARIKSSYIEEHRAPFEGTVNAAFVTRGTRVTSGTNLYQILDCTRPVILIPIPDNRISEFAVGMRVTVYPTDTEQALPGKISYVTSGALIGADTSIQVEQGLLLKGNRAVVALDDTAAISDMSKSCETQRRAVVVIHTKSWYDTIATWISGFRNGGIAFASGELTRVF